MTPVRGDDESGSIGKMLPPLRLIWAFHVVNPVQ